MIFWRACRLTRFGWYRPSFFQRLGNQLEDHAYVRNTMGFVDHVVFFSKVYWCLEKMEGFQCIFHFAHRASRKGLSPSSVILRHQLVDETFCDFAFLAKNHIRLTRKLTWTPKQPSPIVERTFPPFPKHQFLGSSRSFVGVLSKSHLFVGNFGDFQP